MEDYVENYQTSVDTQSGQHWQKMQESLTNTFATLQNANITRIKENKEEAIKQAKIIKDRNNKIQADTLDFTTDLQSKFSKMDPIEFHKTFDKVIQTRANLKARMDAGEVLSSEDKLKYTNAMNAPTLVKNALANQLALNQEYAELIKKAPGSAGAYSTLNLDSGNDKFVKANIPVKDGKPIQQVYTLDDNFTGVMVDTYVGGVSSAPLLGGNLEAAMGNNGNGGFYKVVDKPGYIDSVKNDSKIYYSSKDDLKSGESSSLIGSIRSEYFNKKEGKKVPIGKDGDYKIIYPINAEGEKIIKEQIDAKVATMSSSDLLTYGNDILKWGNIKNDKMYWISDPNKRDVLLTNIKRDMFESLDTNQPEMDFESAGVKIYPGPKKIGKSGIGATATGKVSAADKKQNQLDQDVLSLIKSKKGSVRGVGGNVLKIIDGHWRAVDKNDAQIAGTEGISNPRELALYIGASRSLINE